MGPGGSQFPLFLTELGLELVLGEPWNIQRTIWIILWSDSLITWSQFKLFLICLLHLLFPKTKHSLKMVKKKSYMFAPFQSHLTGKKKPTWSHSKPGTCAALLPTPRWADPDRVAQVRGLTVEAVPALRELPREGTAEGIASRAFRKKYGVNWGEWSLWVSCISVFIVYWILLMFIWWLHRVLIPPLPSAFPGRFATGLSFIKAVG